MVRVRRQWTHQAPPCRGPADAALGFRSWGDGHQRRRRAHRWAPGRAAECRFCISRVPEVT